MLESDVFEFQVPPFKILYLGNRLYILLKLLQFTLNKYCN